MRSVPQGGNARASMSMGQMQGDMLGVGGLRGSILSAPTPSRAEQKHSHHVFNRRGTDERSSQETQRLWISIKHREPQTLIPKKKN